MEIIFYTGFFVFGLIIGSFLNAVIYRIWAKRSFLKGRSFCPYCKHPLSWKDLIPLLSFLILRGKCRYCRKPISWQYPLVEISAGLLFVFSWSYIITENNFLSFNFLPPNGELFSVLSLQNLLAVFYLLIVSSLLLVIFVYDLKHYIIPDQIIYPAIIIAGIFSFLPLPEGFNKFSFLSAVLAAGFFLAIVLISRGKWMGMGDVKLAFFMGLFLGFPKILPALFLSFLIGAIIGTGLILAKKKTLKSEVPFGPFLIIGTFIALFWGKIIIDWYLNLLKC